MSFLALEPQLVWGLVPRIVGLLYLLGFVPVLFQHHVMPGTRALLAPEVLRERARRDFPGLRGFFDQPSLLWLNDSDAMQFGIALAGALCGAVAIYGGPLAPFALGVAWVCWVSLEARGLAFPWDTMLQEVGFLALFLPTAEPLPSLEASALPLPSVAFAVRWLVLRLMLGFGKDKFLETRRDDFLFLRGFFIWMPLPSPLGWWAHHAPAWFLRASLAFMFVAEVIAPVLGLFSGPARSVAFLLLVALQLGIQLTGNWGFFNIGYALLCICLLDVDASIFDLGKSPWAERLTSFPDLAVHLTMAALFAISLFYLPNNSWASRSWVNLRPEFFAIPHRFRPMLMRLHRALAPLRAIAGFRLVNGYGVFPPHSAPPMRLVPVFEGSRDGVHWQQYGYRFMPSFADQAPPMLAPYHARFDQFTYYVTMGMDTGSLFGSLFPLANPYMICTRAVLFDIVAQRILQHDRRILRHFGHNPFPDAPPKLVRVSILAMTATRPSELRATGHWWHVRRVGNYLPPRALVDWSERLMVNEPETFHPDLVDAKARALPLRKMLAAVDSGMELDLAVLEASDLTAAEVERFWSEFVPLLGSERGEWSRLHARAAELEQRYGVEGLYRLERLLERYVWILRQRTEPYRFGTREQTLPPMTNYAYHMVLHEVVCDGREAYLTMLAEPQRVVERERSTSQATQLWAIAHLRYDQFMAHVRCFRSTEMGIEKGEARLPSFLSYHDFVRGLVPPDEQFTFDIIKHADGEFSIPGFYPPPPIAAPATDTSPVA